MPSHTTYALFDSFLHVSSHTCIHTYTHTYNRRHCSHTKRTSVTRTQATVWRGTGPTPLIWQLVDTHTNTHTHPNKRGAGAHTHTQWLQKSRTQPLQATQTRKSHSKHMLIARNANQRALTHTHVVCGATHPHLRCSQHYRSTPYVLCRIYLHARTHARTRRTRTFSGTYKLTQPPVHKQPSPSRPCQPLTSAPTHRG